MERIVEELRTVLKPCKNIKVGEYRETYIYIENDCNFWRKTLERNRLIPFCKKHGLTLVCTTNRGAYDYMLMK